MFRLLSPSYNHYSTRGWAASNEIVIPRTQRYNFRRNDWKEPTWKSYAKHARSARCACAISPRGSSGRRTGASSWTGPARRTDDIAPSSGGESWTLRSGAPAARRWRRTRGYAARNAAGGARSTRRSPAACFWRSRAAATCTAASALRAAARRARTSRRRRSFWRRSATSPRAAAACCCSFPAGSRRCATTCRSWCARRRRPAAAMCS